MIRRRVSLALFALAVVGSGVVVAQTENAPTPPDPIGEILREAARQAEQLRNAEPEPQPAPEAAPEPAPPPTETAEVVREPDVVDEVTQAEVTGEVTTITEEVQDAGPRARHGVVVVQILDKVSAETERFEVRVGGSPVRSRGLIFTARACETSAEGERVRDAAAYLEISARPPELVQQGQPQTRQVYRGWMFASTPSVSPLEHPLYDAWVVGCRS